MVLLLQKFTFAHQYSSISKNNRHSCRSSKPYSALLQTFFHNLFFKLENHHHHPRDALSASLQAFRTDVSNYFINLSSDPKHGSNSMSLIWIQQFLAILPMISKAFVKLQVEINYPTSKWEASSVDEYLKYTLNLLEFLNLISSSLSHLSQARLSLSHTVSLIQETPSLAVDQFHGFKSKSSHLKFKAPQIEPIEESEFHCWDEERIIHFALADMQKIGSWVCGIVLSSLSVDAKSSVEIRKWVVDSSFMALDSNEEQKQGPLKEVRDIKEAADYLVSAMANEEEGDDEAKELMVRLEVLEKGLMDVKKEGDSLFSEVLATRNELLDRFRNKSN